MPKLSSQNSVVSSATQPLNLRMRADVSAQRQSYQGRDYWVLKDPISLKYFRFEEEEFALLQMLDGTRSPEQIKRQFDYDFAPQKITLQELYQFVGMLYRSCLLVSDAAGQGVELKKRGDQKSFQQLKGTLSNVLAVRFRGFDPDSLLNFLDRWLWWVFTWPMFLGVLLLWFSAAALLFTHFENFNQKLPTFHDFFASQNWIWLALVMAVTKIIHEFGHGLACKRFGGQCHEMGVMLLVLTPCLYCNVSDSWTLPNKWKRAMIAAAGMYVELIMAAIAVFVWWFSQPGIVNQLALNIVFVSSVSTILFNGNPLLRYDGYYILSDLLEIPNLRQKASTVLQRQLASWTMGIESRPDPFLPTRRKWFFAFYSIAASAYRWFITFTIFWFLYSLLEPYGVKVIGQMIALLAIWGLIGMPLIQAYRFFSVPGRFGTVDRGRTVLSLCVIAATVFGILMIPIPRYVRCPFILQPQNMESVYVDVPGTLSGVYVSLGERVSKGQRLLQLDSNELTLQITQLKGKIKNAELEYNALFRASQASHDDQSVTDELELARVQYNTTTKNLELRKQEIEKLTIVAPGSGKLIPPERVPQTNSDSGALHTWNGYPLEARNIGSYLEQSTVVARLVPDSEKFEAILTVDQSEIEFVETGHAVELLPHAMPGKSIFANVGEISTTKMKSVPKGLSSRYGGDLVTSQNEAGLDVPQSATFQVSVPFDLANAVLSDGCTGKAKIQAGSQTIGQRLLRLFQKTFRFDL